MALTDQYPRQFCRDDVEIISSEPLYQGFFRANKYRFRHKLFSGGWSPEMDREVFERGHAVVVLPYDPVTDQVVLQEQFRIGAFVDDTTDNMEADTLRASQSPWQVELVAGVIDAGETPEQVAHREAEEEAGLVLKRLEFCLSYLATPGGSTERIRIYIGQVDATGAGGVHGLIEEGEDIKVRVVSREQALHWLENGQIDNAATIIALQWLQLHGERVRCQWTENTDPTESPLTE